MWKKPFGSKGETIIVVDDEREEMVVGYGTWAHVEDESSVLRPTQIEIAWFAIHLDYQSTKYDEAHSVADVVYAAVERAARAHEESTDDMTITLTCHINNRRALRFYERTGFKLIPDPKLQVERDIYFRLIR